MRKRHAALAASALTTALGSALLLGAGSAQAAPAAPAAPASALSPACDSVYLNHKGDGNVRAYFWANCDVLLGAAQGDDSDWGNAAGPFQGSDNNNARSLVNTGTFSGGVNDVQFYKNTGTTGPTGCLDWNELYVDNLSDNHFNDGTAAQDAISSHKWVSGCTWPWT
jgi:hypothetical protein